MPQPDKSWQRQHTYIPPVEYYGPSWKDMEMNDLKEQIEAIIRKVVEKNVLAERRACAEIADRLVHHPTGHDAETIRNEIMLRGNPGPWQKHHPEST